ncbi:putative nitrogenase cofactor biosynthesis protein NifB [Clostridia bacterium]|nr:putative nitrogenase cofactor biosynthesis protein NifB [Clostridia bacterium]
MSHSIREIKASHPCFSLGKPNNKGRIHLPVSPGCNIACKFCERSINSLEQRPGVTAQIITPKEALEVVRKAVFLSPDITVVGIAGPGDTLATPYALETFRLVKREFPKLIKCMSTNGLLLPERAEELIEIGIDTLTVTVNDIYADTLVKLNDRITYHSKVIKGKEAANILIANQLEGIRRVTKAGMIVKVNTVLVPKINGDHIGEIAKAVKEAGASLYNIIPLIPQHELADHAPPECGEIDSARSEAEKYIQVFRHCQHCRADAIGVPGGEDLGEQIYKKRVASENTFSHG